MILRKMKVAHILEGFAGGTCTYMCSVLPQLVTQGFDVTLIGSLGRCCPDALERISRLRRSGVKVELISMSREISVFQDLRSFAAILRLLSRDRFDIVHTHCSKAGALGRIAALVTAGGVRVHSPHCFSFLRCGGRLHRRVYLNLERLLGRFTTSLVAVGQSEAAVAVGRRIVPRRRCTPVSNGLPDSDTPFQCMPPATRDSIKAFFGLPPGTQFVLTVCRLVDYKGVSRFLQAARISKAHNAVFLVAGDGELKAWATRFVCEYHLGYRVRLLGHVSDMERLYAISDIVALCSDAEAMPYSLLEAMRAGCPIVATSVPGSRELIVHNQTGFLVAPQPGEIAGAIDDLLANAQKRSDLARRAYAHFCTHHTLEQQVAQLTQVYRDAIVEGGSPIGPARSTTL